jgi:acyl-coenzyme A thioesterase PaaI-like protein
MSGTALFEQIDSARFQPTEHSRGPWDPTLLHGGPIAALLAHQLLDGRTVGEWFPARITVDLMRPVPLAPLDVTTTVLRAGRKAQLLGADCSTDGVPVARATMQLIAARDVPIPHDSPARHWAEVGKMTSPETTPRMEPTSYVGDVAFHVSSVQHRSPDNALSGGGPGSDWIRVHVDLLQKLPLSPFERVVCAADFSNGISSSLPFDNYTFVNSDLSVQIFRLPVDEWVKIDAVTHASDGGVGMADSRLLDRTGLLGRACQSLVIAAR